MRPLNSLNQGLARLEEVLLNIFLLSMIVLAFLQVVARNFFDTGILWADAFVRILVLWVGMIGAIRAAQAGQHLSIDIFAKFLGERGRKILGIFAKLFAAVVCLYLLEAAYRFVGEERRVGGYFFKGVPHWVVESILPVSFVLIPFHFLVAIANDIKSLVSGRSCPS